jgi:hypothetical protein
MCEKEREMNRFFFIINFTLQFQTIINMSQIGDYNDANQKNISNRGK